MQVRRVLSALAAIIVLITITNAVAGPDRLDGTPRSSITEFLLSEDFVCVGTLVAVAPTTGPYRTGGAPQRRDFIVPFYYQLTIDVDQVLVGAVPTRQIVVNSIIGPPVRRSSLPARVLAWSYRKEMDHWALWGSVATIDRTGTLIPTDAAYDAFMGDPDSLGRNAPALIAALRSKQETRGFNSLTDLTGLALVVVTGQETERAEATFQVRRLGCVLGTGNVVPGYLRVRNSGLCFPLPEAGDSLLVPVSRTDTGDSRSVAGCLKPFRVMRGFVPALGVALAQLDSAYVVEQGKLVPKKVP